MKFSALILGFILALSATATGSSAAESSTLPTPAQLTLAHRYIELIHIDKTYADAMRSMGPAILASLPKGDGKDPALPQKVLDATNEAAADMMVTLTKQIEPVMAARLWPSRNKDQGGRAATPPPPRWTISGDVWRAKP